MKAHVQIPGTDRTFCGKAVNDRVLGPDVKPCETCEGLSRPDSKSGVMLAQAVRKGVKVKRLKMVPTAEDMSGLPVLGQGLVMPVMPARKELSQHDLEIVKRSVKLAMGGGYGQVYAWFGTGAKEHWADSVALGIVTAREGVVDTDWVHQVRLAVYAELKLETVDVATPFRMSDLDKRTSDPCTRKEDE